MNNKKGITVVTIVIYVVIFFALTTFAVAISNNLNYKMLEEKGNIYINENYSKLVYNLYTSAKNSKYIDNISSKIVFSNNDEYYYDSDKKAIYKNGGILVDSVEKFEKIDPTSITDNTLVDSSKYICYSVSFLKYGETLEDSIFVVVGE